MPVGDPLPLHLNEADAIDERFRHRAARLALPAVTVQEWAELHGVPTRTANAYANDPDNPLNAWRSGSVWLVRPTQPRPAPKPQGRPAHRQK